MKLLKRRELLMGLDKNNTFPDSAFAFTLMTLLFSSNFGRNGIGK